MTPHMPTLTVVERSVPDRAGLPSFRASTKTPSHGQAGDPSDSSFRRLGWGVHHHQLIDSQLLELGNVLGRAISSRYRNFECGDVSVVSVDTAATALPIRSSISARERLKPYQPSPNAATRVERGIAVPAQDDWNRGAEMRLGIAANLIELNKLASVRGTGYSSTTYA